jgi:putative ABC transport system permease protein
MASLINGFDRSMRSQIEALGPDTMMLAQLSGVSMISGANIRELMMRPVLTAEDARAIEAGAPSVAIVDLMIGQGDPTTSRRIHYRNERTKTMPVFGTTERWSDVMRLPMAHGRFFTAGEVQRRQRVAVLGQTAYTALFPAEDPIGKHVRIDRQQYRVVGIAEPQPSPGGMNLNQDDFVVIPMTTYQRHFGIRPMRMGRGEIGTMVIIAVPREGLREQARGEVENIMRIRHGLRLDEPNDFDLLNQDAILEVWTQITQATFLALIVLSSIALMVGGIGVMSIMTISVTERTREIGVRKAIGARRVEVLWQFLFEAVFLTTAGGVLGILCGSGIGLLVHYLTNFPVSLPWWSFALGVGFSAAVGIFFGMVPAIRASRLDPIEALRHE